MTTPCPVKLASPCNCTHITRSPGRQSVSPARSSVFSSANCFARVFPSATGLIASRCDGFGSSDTFTGFDAPAYCRLGDAAGVWVSVQYVATEWYRLTEMADHVSGTAVPFGQFGAAFDLVEEGRGREVEHPGEEIETAAVWHANDDVLNTSCVIALSAAAITKSTSVTDHVQRTRIVRPERAASTRRLRAHTASSSGI